MLVYHRSTWTCIYPSCNSLVGKTVGVSVGTHTSAYIDPSIVDKNVGTLVGTLQ